jgi:hypothetical protein
MVVRDMAAARTACIVDGHSLLHNDRDFDPFEEALALRIIHP